MAEGAQLQKQAQEEFEKTGNKQRWFGDFAYSADLWHWLLIRNRFRDA